MASRMSSGMNPRDPSTDSSRQKISAARTLNGSSAAPMSTTRPPGPAMAMACSSARIGGHWSTTSAPTPPVRSRTAITVDVGCRDHLVGAQAAGERLLGRRARDRDDPGPQDAAQLDGVGAQPPDPQHHQRLTRLDARCAEAVERGWPPHR